MEINNNTLDIMKLHNKKNATREEKDAVIEARKKDPVLDNMLYSQDMAEMHSEIAKTEQLARKYAKGEKLSEDELKYLKEKNPDLFKRAEEAKRKADQLRENLKKAKTKSEQMALIGSAMAGVSSLAKYEKVSAQILSEALNKAVSDFNKDNEGKNDKNSKIKEAAE